MPLIIPFHPETASATIVIDGVTYRVPLVDSDGHLQVDVQNLTDLSGALASVGTDELRTRIIANVLATDAATATNQATMITALQLIDDLRAALDAVRTDRLNVNVYRDGASEVKNLWAVSPTSSTTKATFLTPTAGKKIRVVACHMATSSATGSFLELYFGTGANISSDATKAIMYPWLDIDTFAAFGLAWPDGGGPVGDVDEVISIRTSNSVSTGMRALLHYREE
ncbi:hypothetical protein LCGC14_1571850 [marine sediment metagenome]|uniref:Uncharacterized protein n=1 Tax=marine sediment metagenome TaxID=412755 RepID=A0A0F9IJK7_9ZZZZ